jgi:hypothetical protein
VKKAASGTKLTCYHCHRLTRECWADPCLVLDTALAEGLTAVWGWAVKSGLFRA